MRYVFGEVPEDPDELAEQFGDALWVIEYVAQKTALEVWRPWSRGG